MESIVAGSYDRFLFGFQCSTSGRTEETLTRKFTYPAHKGPIKCVAASAPYLVSGGADDLIHLYDLQSDVDLGFLMSPGDGAVSALAFHAVDRNRHPGHLFSGSADGSLSIWQAGGEWVCLKSFHGHKKEVNSIAVHPSGRLALSVSADSTLRLWNLVKGKSAHESTLPIPADQVAFSPSGKSFAMVQGTEVALQDVGQAPKAVMNHSRRVLCLAFPGENAILTGSEEGAVRLWDPRASEQPVLLIQQAHKTRVKGVAPLSSSVVEQAAGLVASASTDGVVKLWDFRKVSDSSPRGAPHAVATAATGARLTCLASIDPTCATAAKAHSRESVAQEPMTKESLKHRGGTEQAAKLSKASKTATAKQAQASAGVAHDGVVDFSQEVIPKQKQGYREDVAMLKANGVKSKVGPSKSSKSNSRATVKRKR